jgi:hypothetical protein
MEEVEDGTPSTGLVRAGVLNRHYYNKDTRAAREVLLPAAVALIS